MGGCMRIKNCITCCELRSEDSIETQAIQKASMRSYSPRASGIMRDGGQCIVLSKMEAQEFASGVLRDIDIDDFDKWSICLLVLW